MHSRSCNTLKGRVKQVTSGAGTTEVTIELPGGTDLVSMLTTSGAERLHLGRGTEVYAIIKVSHVLVATASPCGQEMPHETPTAVQNSSAADRAC